MKAMTVGQLRDFLRTRGRDMLIVVEDPRDGGATLLEVGAANVKFGHGEEGQDVVVLSLVWDE